MHSFEKKNVAAIGEALDIAEDVTAGFYKFSAEQWKRHRYDVKTLQSLRKDEISEYAFALLNKVPRVTNGHESRGRGQDFYFICLQDHHIMRALKRDRELDFIPLLVYVFTHELVHIVRFCNFYQRFEVSDKYREKEEQIVHNETYNILMSLSLPKIDYVLKAYERHRLFDMVGS
ncbi:hypothetical protein ACFL2O_01265 [Thermodesulfobacteriota bacterium]